MIMRIKNFFLILTIVIIHLVKPFASLSNYCSQLTDNQRFVSTFKSCYAKNSLNYEYLSLFNRVTASFESQSYSTSILIDMVRLVEVAKRNENLKTCLESNCGLFSGCEFPIESKFWNGFETEVSAASRLATLLTSMAYNEEIDSKLVLKNFRSLLEFTLLDNVNIYECKIIYKDSNKQNLNLQATKSFKEKSKQIVN